MLRSFCILTGIFAALSGMFTAGSVLAAEPKTPVVAFGTVDIEAAFNNYEKKNVLEQEVLNLFQQMQQKLEMRKTNSLLTQEEFDQLAELKAKSKPTEADNKKIDELLSTSRQREQLFQSLQQKSDATETEKAQLKEFQDRVNKTNTTMREDENKYQIELQKKRVELSGQVMKDVDAAVAAVAKEKNLSLIFNKSLGEPGLVVYSNADITDEVLKRLNKK